MSLLVLIVVAGAALSGLWFYQRVMSAKAHLTTAQADLTGVVSDYKAGNKSAALSDFDAAASEIRLARQYTDHWTWRWAEKAPKYGEDFTALRVLVAEGDDFVTYVSPTATRAITLEPSSVLVKGRVNVSAITDLTSSLPDIEARLRQLRVTLTQVDSPNLVPQIREPLQKLTGMVDQGIPLLHKVNGVTSYLPDLLGAKGARQYLILFQNNAEARSLGGGPESFMLVRVDDGAITVIKQANGSDFVNGRKDPIATVPPEIMKVYVPNLLQYVADFSGYPDFPTAARLAQAWWATHSKDEIDGVVSFDPVALSYVLAATGPVKIPSGETLTTDNAVDFLLNQVYVKYPNPAIHREVFSSAAQALFTALTSGIKSPTALVGALQHSVAERRLLFYSNDSAEQAAFADYPAFQGVIPKDTATSTTTGVFLWDTSSSKVDYYLTTRVSLVAMQCSPKGTTTWTVDVTLSTNITKAQTQALPDYVVPKASRADGYFTTNVYVHGPQGSTLVGVEFLKNWAGQGKDAEGVIDGRPAVRLGTRQYFGDSETIRLTFTRAGQFSTNSVQTTPGVRTTETSAVTEQSCG